MRNDIAAGPETEHAGPMPDTDPQPHVRRAPSRRRRAALIALTAAAVVYLVASLRVVDVAVLVGGAGVAAVLCATLSVIVAIHELAHLAVGRALGIRSDAFSVGFGPEVIGIDRGGIRWSLRAIPLGGFVRVRGEADPAVAGGLAAAGLPRIVAVYLAGPLANLGLAAATAAGIAIARGVSPERVPFAVAAILGTALSVTVDLVVRWIPMMFANLAAMPFGGLPSMYVAFSQAVHSGPFLLAVLFVLLNLSVGLMNLLPIPPLDGGHALLAVARARLGPRLPEATVRRTVRVGFGALAVVMVVVNVLDAIRWIAGGPPPGI